MTHIAPSRLLEGAARIRAQAEEQGRSMTAAEQAEVDRLVQQSRDILTKGLTWTDVESINGGPYPHGGGAAFGGPGDIFTRSEGYIKIKSPETRPQTWSSGMIEVGSAPYETKGTLLTTPGAGLTPATYQPGIVQTLFQEPTVADLIPSQQVDGSPVRYIVEGTATNAAAATSEAAAKPESTFGFTETEEPIRKIATFLPVSDEMLEDAPQIQAYLNGRLGLFVRQAEEAQLLSGNGSAPNLSGLLGRVSNVWGRGTVDSNAVAIFKGANGVRGSAFLNPDAIVMNPANWQTTRLLTDSQGQFYGGGPFEIGPYGGPQGPTASSYPAAQSLWGMRLVVTSAIGAGTALVGSFSQAAAVYRRGGLSVEASNSHSDYFQRNLTAIRAEERIGLAVFRPAAFTKVTGLS
jgi:HK97 family phage major capsid protein